jgi:ribonucleoside-triphosphate reductase
MIKKYKLFTTPMCPNCPEIKEFMKTVSLEGEQIDATTPEGLKEASAFNVTSVPTVIFLDENDKVVNSAHTIDDIKKVIENKSLSDL